MVHEKKRYSCEVCEYAAVNESAINYHIANAHSHEVLKYAFDECDYSNYNLHNYIEIFMVPFGIQILKTWPLFCYSYIR